LVFSWSVSDFAFPTIELALLLTYYILFDLLTARAGIGAAGSLCSLFIAAGHAFQAWNTYFSPRRVKLWE
jgi:hypothetical protein